jgi:hypothetical protein
VTADSNPRFDAPADWSAAKKSGLRRDSSQDP